MILLLFLLSLTFTLPTTKGAYNVLDFGAKLDGVSDNREPFLNAWAKVCDSKKPASIYVPPGNFLVSEINFIGPCENNDVVIYIDGTIVAPKWHESGTKTWIVFKFVEGLSIVGGSIDGQGKAVWDCKVSGLNDCPEASTSLTIAHSTDVTIKCLTSLNSKGFHISVYRSSRVQVHNVRISAPSDSPNTDGIHVQMSDNIVIHGSNIRTGDDCVSMGAGANNVMIRDIYCGPGHGISIGSLGSIANEQGVRNINVSSVVFHGTTNGLRIKTWANPFRSYVQFVIFQNIVMYDVQNPVLIDQQYCPSHKNCPHENSGVKISTVIYSDIRGSSASEIAVKFDCSASNPCQGISMQDIRLTYQNQKAKSFCNNAHGFSHGVTTPRSCLR